MIHQKKEWRVQVLVVLCYLFCILQKESMAGAIPAGFSGGDGKSFASAVVMPYIGDYEKSIDQEYQYITAIFGVRDHGWAFEEQELIQKNDKFYDKVTIKILFSKEIVSLFFDITEPHTALQQHLTHTQ